MRAKIHSILIGTVACAQLGAVGALAAHPTHSLSRESRRLVIPALPHGSAAAHHHAGHGAASAHHTAPHASTSEHAHANAHGAHRPAGHHSAPELAHHKGRRGTRAAELATRNSDRDTPTGADRATAERVHAWEQTQQPDGHSAALTTTLNATTPELPRVPTIEQEASTPLLLPSLYDKRGHLVMPPPLYGTHEILVHQNLMADHDGLTRVRDDEDLADLRRQRLLVALPESDALHVDERLPENRRYTRPWTAQFLAVLSRDFYNRFHEPLQVNSAVRTVAFQEHLIHTNGNAAPPTGETASPHLTGQAVDIGKRSLSLPEIAWMRDYLQPLIEQGKIDVEEEFQQSCFHISVYRAYRQPSHLNFAATPELRPAGDN